MGLFLFFFWRSVSLYGDKKKPDGYTDGQTEGCTYGRRDRWTNGRMKDGPTGGRVYGRMDRRADGRTNFFLAFRPTRSEDDVALLDS